MIFILGKTNYKISEKERTKRPTCQEVNNQIGTCIYFSFHLFSQQVFQGIQLIFSGNGALWSTTVKSKSGTKMQSMLDLHQSINPYMQNESIKYHKWKGLTVWDTHLNNDKFKYKKGSNLIYSTTSQGLNFV